MCVCACVLKCVGCVLGKCEWAVSINPEWFYCVVRCFSVWFMGEGVVESKWCVVKLKSPKRMCGVVGCERSLVIVDIIVICSGNVFGKCVRSREKGVLLCTSVRNSMCSVSTCV